MTASMPDDPRFAAALDLLGRTGIRQFQLRYSDDEELTVWMAIGQWRLDRRGHPLPRGGKVTYECAGATTPLLAVMRLLDETMDGGTCAHCGRPSGVSEDWQGRMPLDKLICWYRYDPEMHTFRRSCEGET